ncbi:thiamine pyrophosphate-dependent enzyme [Candidimonas nitroreducens]|uniref:Thiamine pyrophosphate enzyme TPP-binding domain-containing protein n=1 Tax=Candidimonas nitroreducens TaxID=683354 RepID=A0A225MTA7_9BURK|nr:thiamine pyrophosphate-dependent enzyme [Candidimonas nitroreducens]OWT61889.1 hypothetical protein CEY11_08660 [Candidimonas nitroreducens]
MKPLTKTMSRAELTRRVVDQSSDEDAIIGGIGHTNFELWNCGHRPCNFYMLGSMGLTTSIGLGVALVQPQRRVVVLEGDGSLLMQLGSLATLASQRPKRFLLVVWDNEAYQITGGQPTQTALGADLVAIASGCGIEQAHWARDEADFDRLLQASKAAEGPFVIVAKTERVAPASATERDPAQLRDRFMRGLGAKKEWPAYPGRAA